MGLFVFPPEYDGVKKDSIMAKRLKYKYHTENDQVDKNEIYVFASNLAGLHRETYSQVAIQLYGAETGTYLGLLGSSYAIPVKDRFVRPLTIEEIRKYVAAFKEFTLSRPDLNFYVVRLDNCTKLLNTWQVAMLFVGCGKNCRFPVQWKPYLK